MESVLEAYHTSLGGSRRGAPRELLGAATAVDEAYVSAHLPGPADATAEEPADGMDASGACEDSNASVLDTGHEGVSFLRLWNAAISKYQVLRGLDEAYVRTASRCKDEDARRRRVLKLGPSRRPCTPCGV